MNVLRRLSVFLIFLFLFSFQVIRVSAEEASDETEDFSYAETLTEEETEEEEEIVPDETKEQEKEIASDEIEEQEEEIIPAETEEPEEAAEEAAEAEEKTDAAEEIAEEPAEEEKSGFVIEDDETRYYDPQTHEMVTGEALIDGYTYYFNNETGTMVTGWNSAEELENTTYYDAQGHRVYGLMTIDDNIYFFDALSGALHTKQKKIDGFYYYFDDETGAMITGWKEIPEQEKTVYYDPFGRMLYGFQDIDGNRYYFNLRTGGAEKNQEKIDGYYYYFDDDTFVMVTGWKDIPEAEKRVYYNDAGRMLYGFQNIEDNRYYFHPSTGALSYNQKKIDGYYYYFDDETAVMVTGWKDIEAQNKRVYYNDAGRMQYGFQTIDSNRYYFHPGTGALSYNQKKIDGYYYYFDDETGIMVTGWKDIPAQNKRVYYNNAGRMQYGFQTIDGNRYYFNPDSGALSYNQKKINGYYYYFDDETGIMVTGWKEIKGNQNKTVFYDNNGRMVHGKYTYQGVLYAFHNSTGALIGNFIDTSKGKQFRYTDGSLASGQKQFGNDWYYFDESTHLMVTGFKRISSQHKTVFYDNDGIMKHSNFWYKDSYYLVNSASGAIKFGPDDGIWYYSQLDSRWATAYYGGWQFGGTGCGVTTLAMAISSLKGYTVDPLDVADFLYAYGEFNNRAYGIAGNTGSANPAAADHWDIEWDHITSYSSLREYLQGGAIVAAIVGPGSFCPAGATHEILLYGYSGGATRVYDPLGNRASGWADIEDVWDQQSTHWMDTDAGTPFFAFYVY